MNMREVQDVIIWIAFFGWAAFTVFAVEELGIDAWSAIGFGTVMGVLLAMIKDMWQFYHRKAQGVKK